MEKYARVTGYLVALAMLAGLLSLVALLREDLLFPHNRVRVSFPSIGTLMEDDPVNLQGVQVGRVSKIEAGQGESVATLEFFHRTRITKGSRFINFNYSLFGARMVILVPGTSPEPLDASVIHQGDFSTGVAETIHKVEDLLVTVMEYKRLSSRLELGSGSTLSLQGYLTTKVYPVLEEFGKMAHDLQILQNEVATQLERLTSASIQVDRFGRDLSAGSDTLIHRANRTLAQLASLTAQSTLILRSLEEVLIAGQDTTKGPSRFLVQRDLYDRALSLTHAMQDLLKVVKKEGLKDVIHFWRNVHFR